jgi:hypothetical protein
MSLCGCFSSQLKLMKGGQGDGKDSGSGGSAAEVRVSEWLVKSFIEGLKGNDEFRQLKQHLVTSLQSEISEFCKQNVDSLLDQQQQVHQLQQKLKTKEEHIELLESTVFELQSLLRRLTVKLEEEARAEEEPGSPSSPHSMHSCMHSTHSGSNEVTVDDLEITSPKPAPAPAVFSLAHLFRGRAECHAQHGTQGRTISDDTIEQFQN